MRKLVAQLAQALDADLSVRLWNGERLSLRASFECQHHEPGALTLAINDPDCIGQW